MIRLFSTCFPVPDPLRRAEYDEALRRNCDCRAIAEICLLREGDGDLPIDCAKIRVRDLSHRPCYSDYFGWINEIAGPEDISIVANADIYFDEQLELFRRWTLPLDTAFILAPWDVGSSGNSKLRDRNDSQDTWIFRGTVRPIVANYPAGVPRCDNRLAYELVNAGYSVENPSFSIRSNHLHAEERKAYDEEQHTDFIAPPYGYLWPHNLWPLYRILVYNYRHPSTKLGWRFDMRRWAHTLRLHWIAKALPRLK